MPDPLSCQHNCLLTATDMHPWALCLPCCCPQNTTGGTTYEGTDTAGLVTGTAGHHHHSHVTDEVAGERPVAMGIAEVRLSPVGHNSWSAEPSGELSACHA
jgi:hypothetical protein